jgi:hypothetical protein
MCNGGESICVSSHAPDLLTCIFHNGDVDCPSDPANVYTEKHVFYAGIDDTRGCAPCTCGAPAGSVCSASISIYQDNACTSPLDLATVTSAGPVCHDLPVGSALGSKSASAPTYTPGACLPAGGEPTGAATGDQPGTFCCIPP